MSEWGGSRVPKLRAQVIATYGTTCHLCREPITGLVSVDHVITRSNGGSDDLSNLRPAHESCNYSRGDKPIEEYQSKHSNELDWFLELVA